jgi:uncharacterized protein
MPNRLIGDFNVAPAGFVPNDLVPPPLIERERPVTSLALDVAGRCNIACRYCAEASTQPTHRPFMTEAILEQAVEMLMPDGRARPGSTIRLGSGEPLLALPLLKKLAILLAENRSDEDERPQVFLTTNGTLADAETREWLVNSGWQVKISLDGPSHVHDRWRVTGSGAGTYERVAEAVADLARRMPERLSVTAVLCRGSDPAEVFEGIAALGVRRIELVPAVHSDLSVVPGEVDVRHYAEFADAWAENYVRAGADPDDGVDAQRWPELVRLVNTARRVMGYDVNRIVCGAGRNFYGIGHDGALYPCFRFVGIERHKLGDVTRGPLAQATRQFRQYAGRPYEERAACRACWAAPLCGGPCFASAELFGPGGGEPCAIQCRYIRADAHAAVRLVERLRETDPERLLDLLGPLVAGWEDLLDTAD